jgi:hypothetical protein
MRVPFINGRRVDSRPRLITITSLRKQLRGKSPCIAIRSMPWHTATCLRQVGLIKIDVEGHEFAVINGATQFLTTRQPLLLIEIEARHHQFPIATIFGRLEALGYRGYYANPQTATLLPVRDFVVARDQDPAAIATRQFSRYLNNFFLCRLPTKCNL